MKKVLSLLLCLLLIISSTSISAFAETNVTNEPEPMIIFTLTDEGEKLPADFVLTTSPNGVSIRKSDINKDGTLKRSKYDEYVTMEFSDKKYSDDIQSRTSFQSVTIRKHTDTPQFKQDRTYTYMSSYRADLAAQAYFHQADYNTSLGVTVLLAAGGWLMKAPSIPAFLVAATGILSTMSAQKALSIGNQINNLRIEGYKVLLYNSSERYFNQTIVSIWDGVSLDYSLNNPFEVIRGTEYFTN